MSAVLIYGLKIWDLQVPAIHSSPGEAGQQAGKQVLAANRISVGTPFEWPHREVRIWQACL